MWAKFMRLGSNDLVRGFVVAMFTTVAAIIMPIINQLANGVDVSFPSWKILLYAALAGGIGYLTKNFFSNSKDEMFKTEPKETP